jgi:hypothetical protein
LSHPGETSRMTGNIFNKDTNKDFERKTNFTCNKSFTKNKLYDIGLTLFKSSKNKRTLKLTEYRKTWIHNQVRKYAAQIGIIANDMPHVFYTRKEVLAIPKDLTAGGRTVTHKCYGICFYRAKTILINVKKHRSFKDLRDTIVHELVHYRFSYLKHGAKFESRIALIKAGKKYKVKLLYTGEIPPSSSSSNQDQQERFEVHSTLPCLSIVRQKKSYNNNIYNHDDDWTTECLIDELFLRLASTKQTILYNDKSIAVYKYYHQALALRKWIPIAKPAPEFVVNISELSVRLIAELKILDDPQIILKQAVGRIFENIDARQYHLSIAQFLEVVLK